MTGAFQAVVERDVRRFLRNPRLVAAAVLLPIIELIVLGQSIGGNIRDVPLAVIDQDGGPAAAALLQRLFLAETGSRAVQIEQMADLDDALRDIRGGRVAGALIIPPGFSRGALSGSLPSLGLALDNADVLVSAHLRAVLNQTAPGELSGLDARAPVDFVELFPFVDYTQYLTPGAIALAIYITCFLGGGIMYVDDRASGAHEGYLATPVTAFELTTGMVFAGALKAVVCSAFVATVGLIYAGLAARLDFNVIVLLAVVTGVSALALSGLVTAATARLRDVFLSRLMVAALNLVLLLPSGAIWPVVGFPEWMRVISRVDPFTYIVHAYRTLLLRDVSWDVVATDVGLLSAFAAGGLLASWAVLPRRL